MQESAAVKIWRDTFKLNTSAGFKADIIATVECDGEEGLKLWREILENWFYWKKTKRGWRKTQKNRFDVKHQLSEYEMELEKRKENGR